MSATINKIKPRFFFLTGASGSGKTTILKNIEKKYPESFNYFFFDSVGVPSPEEMNTRFGSGEEWQRVMTHNWARRMKEEASSGKSSILDGQMRFSFIDEACKKNGIEHYSSILVDCSDEERFKRLRLRGHLELANDTMSNWAKYLREEALSRESVILDTTSLNEEEATKELITLLLG